jgi:hypothetical protein
VQNKGGGRLGKEYMGKYSICGAIRHEKKEIRIRWYVEKYLMRDETYVYI